MGMYNWVDYPPTPCYHCGALVDGWQSKDAECDLTTVNPEKVLVFYSSCFRCGRWNQYRVRCLTYCVDPDHPATEVDPPQEAK
jgi:hypothetical protein